VPPERRKVFSFHFPFMRDSFPWEAKPTRKVIQEREKLFRTCNQRYFSLLVSESRQSQLCRCWPFVISLFVLCPSFSRLQTYMFHYVYVSWFLNLLSYRWSYMPDEAKKQKHVSPGYHPCSFRLHFFLRNLPKKTVSCHSFHPRLTLPLIAIFNVINYIHIRK